MVIDIVIALAVVVAVWLGYRYGTIQPLLVEIFALGGLAFLIRHRVGFTDLVGALFHANAAIAVLMALFIAGLLGYAGARLGGAIHRMPSVRGIDGLLGVFVGALTGMLFCYLIISGFILAGSAANESSLNVAQLAAMEAQLGRNPFTGSILTGQDRAQLAAAARRGSVAADSVGALGMLRTLYDDLVQRQIEHSHLAPLVMKIGGHFPGFGHVTSQELPGHQPAVPGKATPAPMATATPKR